MFGSVISASEASNSAFEQAVLRRKSVIDVSPMWDVFLDDNAVPYYANRETGAVQWERPAEME